MLPAARKGDAFFCPTHVGGAIQGPCCPRVQIGGAAAACAGDMGACGSSGTFDSIVRGNPTVLIGGDPAGGMGHWTAHGGKVATGCMQVRIGDPAFGADGKLLQVPQRCQYLLKGLGAIPTDAGPARRLGQLRDRFKLSHGQPGFFIFPEQANPEPVREYEVVIRGHKIKIIEPVSVVRSPGGGLLVGNGMWLPDAPMVAAALASLSDEQLSQVKSVAISPRGSFDPANPEQDPVAYYGGGAVTYFPRAVPHPQSDIDWVLTHESAHAVTGKLGWTLTGEKPPSQREWEDAIWKDNRGVSDYGNTNVLEDFAEAVLMYAMTKGTPCEATARALFPGRYALLEKMFPSGYRPRKSSAGATGGKR